MSSSPTLMQVRDVVSTLDPPGTPLTTSEVGNEFDCTDRTIYNRLETLIEDGGLEIKKVGARGRVWWRPVDERREREQVAAFDLDTTVTTDVATGDASSATQTAKATDGGKSRPPNQADN